MPYFKMYEWDKYKISIVPSDHDRYRLMKICGGHAILPYLYGEISMDLFAKIDKHLTKEPIKYEWQLHSNNNEINRGDGVFDFGNTVSYKSKSIRSGDVIKYSKTEFRKSMAIDLDHISELGQYQIKILLSRLHTDSKELIQDFTVMDRDIFYMGIWQLFLGAMFGAILGVGATFFAFVLFGGM